MEGFLWFLGILVLLGVWAWVRDISDKANKYDQNKIQLEQIENRERVLALGEIKLNSAKKVWEAKVKSDTERIEARVKAENETLEAKIRTEKAALEARLQTEREAMGTQAQTEKIALETRLQAETAEVIAQAQNVKTALEERLRSEMIAIQTLADQKAHGFPWLAEAYEDYWSLQDTIIAEKLGNKKHPAVVAANEVRQISKERRDAEKAASISRGLLEYCKYLAPWLDEYLGLQANELDELIANIHSSWQKKEKELDDEVRKHFGPKYDSLSESEKLQKRLD